MHLAELRRKFSRTDRRQLPFSRSYVVPQNVEVPVITFNLEITLVGGSPTVNNFSHLDFLIIERKTPGCLLCLIAGVTSDPDFGVASIHPAFDPYFLRTLLLTSLCSGADWL